jgi:hypothetical protein
MAPANPFVYGEIVPPDAFLDRDSERAQLAPDLLDGQKVFLGAPRREACLRRADLGTRLRDFIRSVFSLRPQLSRDALTGGVAATNHAAKPSGARPAPAPVTGHTTGRTSPRGSASGPP